MKTLLLIVLLLLSVTAIRKKADEEKEKDKAPKEPTEEEIAKADKFKDKLVAQLMES